MNLLHLTYVFLMPQFKGGGKARPKTHETAALREASSNSEIKRKSYDVRAQFPDRYATWTPNEHTSTD